MKGLNIKIENANTDNCCCFLKSTVEILQHILPCNRSVIHIMHFVQTEIRLFLTPIFFFPKYELGFFRIFEKHF